MKTPMKTPMKTSKTLLIGLAVVVGFVLWIGSMYNGLVRQHELVDAGWAQVETQYQRRFDLIGNLVESTKGTLAQEQEIFISIAEARQGYAGATSPEDRVAAAGQLESSLARLLVIVENYPTLQSNQTVLALMDELAGTENRISVERGRYNEIVREYNVSIKTIPTVFIAGALGFEQREFFESVATADEAPEVDLTIE